MSKLYVLLATFGLFIGGVLSEPTNLIIPCPKNDIPCMTSSAKSALPRFVEGFPDLGIAPSDPLSLDKIDGDLSGLNYIFTDSSATGLKTCDIQNVNLDIDKLTAGFHLSCKNLIMSGHYKISGQIIVLPVQGEGEYQIDCSRYEITVNADMKKVKGSDGHEHIAVKKFDYKSEAQDSVVFTFKNLFNGNKQLSDAVHQFANENWKEVTEYVQEPVISGIIKKVIHNLNKYFKLIPIEELTQS